MVNTEFSEFNNNLCLSRPIFVIGKGSIKFDFLEDKLCNPQPNKLKEITEKQITELIANARGRLLPGFIPYSSAITIIKDTQIKWKSLSLECLNKIYEIMFDFVNDSINQTFSRFPLLDGEMKIRANKCLDDCKETTLKYINFISEMEINQPFTIDETSITILKSSFLKKLYATDERSEPTDALDIIASLLAYFRIVFKRHADTISMTIVHAFIDEFTKRIEEKLMEICVNNEEQFDIGELIQEDHTVSFYREDLRTREKHLKNVLDKTACQDFIDNVLTEPKLGDYFFKTEEERIYGLCEECNELNTYHNWYKSCNATRFHQAFLTWTSGQGSYGSVFHAKRKVQRIHEWDQKNNEWYRHKQGSFFHEEYVALKTIESLSKGFLDKELQLKAPNWERKMDIAGCISGDMMFFHEAGLIHSNLGISILEKEVSHIKDIKGVMPYMAPELLDGRSSYFQATDIYTFDIIMWEISSEEKPFHEFRHDIHLALRICRSYHPEITKEMSLFYRDLMKQCWHSDPTKRPTAKEIYDQILMWLNNPTQEIQDMIHEAEKIRQQNIGIKKEMPIPYSEAIYTSRILTNIIKSLATMNFDDFKLPDDITLEFQ
ncbi:hypothetical protein Glove_153g31 [Diversispora epigaea]|uniref:Protein kinase domain-containing protein n=1 Tax=Diversispora epigaea TaxID=1348612 RepID=A0A397IX31_9GLOM|nr:hypothetical protein Glove_153g31 [Diversispora epigaea]